MPLLALLVPSVLIWLRGGDGKRKQRQRGKSSKSVLQFLHAPGTNQPPFTQACGKSELVPPSRSKFGQVHAGAGSEFASLGGKFQKVLRYAVHNLCTEVVGGTCTPLSKRRSKI